ncbi:MAG: hypothetical protein ACETWR_16590 [Anaerolineae bacterium]
MLRVAAQYAQSRILLWATLFILQAIGIPQKVVALWFGCSTRNVRYINQQVRAVRRGDGKTGRPPKSRELPAEAEPSTVGYSAYAGLWLLVPWLLDSRLLTFTQLLTFTIPIAGLAPWQWVMTVLVLAWLGFSRLQDSLGHSDIQVTKMYSPYKIADLKKKHEKHSPLAQLFPE